MVFDRRLPFLEPINNLCEVDAQHGLLCAVSGQKPAINILDALLRIVSIALQRSKRNWLLVMHAYGAWGVGVVAHDEHGVEIIQVQGAAE